MNIFDRGHELLQSIIGMAYIEINLTAQWENSQTHMTTKCSAFSSRKKTMRYIYYFLFHNSKYVRLVSECDPDL